MVLAILLGLFLVARGEEWIGEEEEADWTEFAEGLFTLPSEVMTWS